MILYAYARDNRNSGISRRGRYPYMRRIIDYCQLIAGKLSSTMSHDQTYDFIRMGRNMERSDMTARVIDVRASNLLPSLSEELKPFDDIQWKSVLDSLAGYQMYRRHVHVRIRGRAVLRFLLKEELFPRTVHYCLSEVEQCLRGLPGNEPALAHTRSSAAHGAGSRCHRDPQRGPEKLYRRTAASACSTE